MTDQEIRDLVTETARAAVRETLSALGVDTDSPRETQADFVWLRKARKGSEDTSKLAKRSAIGVFIPLALWLIYQGVKGYLIEGSN